MSRGRQDRFQRLLRWYPASWRKENGDVFVGSLRDQADHERRDAPSTAERFSAAVNGVALRLSARVALWAAVVAIVLGACAWLTLLAGLSGIPGAGGAVGVVTVGVVPALAALALIALARQRRWITGPRALAVLVTLLVAVALAALTQLSWAEGFRLADANQPQTGLAGAFGGLFVAAWVVGAAGIALFVDGAFYRIGWPWFSRILLGALAGVLAAPVIGVGLISPIITATVAAVVALMALGTLSGRRIGNSPAPAGPGRERSLAVRGAVGWLAVVSAIVGVVGVVYAFTGASWSAGADDGTMAMGQGITILLAAAIPLLTAVALNASQRHGRPAVWGPIGLIVLEVAAAAVAYLYAPAGEEMVLWMSVSAALGGGAVAWWIVPRLRGSLRLRIAVGVALGGGYAALFGTTAIPLLAFTVPALAIVVAFIGTRRKQNRDVPGSGTAAIRTA